MKEAKKHRCKKRLEGSCSSAHIVQLTTARVKRTLTAPVSLWRHIYQLSTLAFSVAAVWDNHALMRLSRV